MSRPRSMRVVAAAACIVLLAAASGSATPTIEEDVSLPPFDKVTLYRDQGQPARVVILLASDPGWDRSAVEMARAIASLDALVIGVDLPAYLRTMAHWQRPEIYPSADLEVLSQFVQKKLHLPRYQPPVLVGYGNGAAMAFAIAAQTRPATFAGSVSLGFCPTLVSPVALGAGTGLATTPARERSTVRLQPAPALGCPWTAFVGRHGDGCEPAAARDFVAATAGARRVTVATDTDAEAPADPEAWLPSLRATLDRIAGTPDATPAAAGDLGDLPLVEVPARGTARGALAVVLSGDGGWASLDREVGDALATAGVGVVGLNSLAYFWTPRTPDGAAADLVRVLRHYRDTWQARRLLLVGYSRGADVLPFLASRLPSELRRDLVLIALLGPGLTTDFEFHLTDWIGGDDPDARPIAPEVARLQGIPVLCVQGDAEDESLCGTLDASLARRVVLAGGHHFGGDYAVIAARILAEAGLAPATPAQSPPGPS